MRRGSSVAKASAKASMPRATAALVGISSQSRISDFCSRIACGPPARIAAASARPRRRAPPAGATAIDEAPGERLGGADHLAGQQQRRARPWPISCGSSAASTTEGMPIRTSGMPNIARSLATRRSQAAASSSPAPSA